MALHQKISYWCCAVLQKKMRGPSPNMACAGDEAALEDLIRTKAQSKGIRPQEFFLDYDKLRSGYVTAKQFFRVLWENFGLKFTEDQEAYLTGKYALKGDGRMCYRAFCDNINQPFNANDLSVHPEAQRMESAAVSRTEQVTRPLSPNSETKLNELLRVVAQHFSYRGVNLRTECENFDSHNIGVINDTQFYRSFTAAAPPGMAEEDIDLIVRRYSDPAKKGLVNYRALHEDLADLTRHLHREGATRRDPAADYLPPEPGADFTVQQVFDKIRVAVHKNRVRSTEFFKDYDRHKQGIITDHQFACGLALAIGKEAQLTREEIQKVVEFYRVDKDNVRYREFCDMLENAFTVPHLEKKPMTLVARPPEGTLGRNLQILTDREEQRVNEVLSQIAETVQKRRIMMYQYFKDFDRSRAYSRIITASQFGRILHFLTLDVPPQDLTLLCKKFADPSSGDINYPAFVQTVDQQFVNFTKDNPGENTRRGDQEQKETEWVEPPPVSFDDLMARIRHIVMTDRLRVAEYFQDYDQLRSGCVSVSQFRRALSSMGMSALGKHNLSNSQFEMLAQVYRNPKQPDNIYWTQFLADIESVFTQTDLARRPGAQVEHQDRYRVPKPGTLPWENASEEHRQFVAAIMDRLRQRATERRVLAKPVFQDFDKHNNGHVTRAQFRQCMTMVELLLTEDEMLALEAKYVNDSGFNYLHFLQELQPQEPVQPMYVERLKELRRTNEKTKLPEREPEGDLDAVLLKIKTRVFKERVRVHEWLRDYDKLRSGRMLKGNFRRALSMCKFELTESELAILEDHYESGANREYVDWAAFNADVERVFTEDGLERAPLRVPDTFAPPAARQERRLDAEQESFVGAAMQRIADKVRQNRMQLFPLFEDYDQVHHGAVSRQQFRRVLTELELAPLVPTEPEWAALSAKFHERVGGRDDVNYVGFCDAVYRLAQFEPRKP